MIRLLIKRAVGIKLHEEGNQWDVQADIMTGRGTGAGMVRYHAGDGRLQGGGEDGLLYNYLGTD